MSKADTTSTSHKKNHKQPYPLSHWLRVLLTGVILVCPVGLAALPDDSAQPIYISSNSLVKDDKQGIATYEGNVTMQQGSLNIQGDKVTLYLINDEVSRIVAVGQPATLKQKPAVDQGDVAAQALTIDYTITNETIQLSEQAKLNQDGSRTESNNIIYNIAAARVEAGSDSGRVNIVIQPQAPVAAPNQPPPPQK